MKLVLAASWNFSSVIKLVQNILFYELKKVSKNPRHLSLWVFAIKENGAKNDK